MPLDHDARCLLRAECLVAACALDGDGPDDGASSLHVLLQVGSRRERLGWPSPTQAARDAARRALGVVAHDGALFDEEEETL